ncbi:ribokinase [Aspergillus clavatus NRRL 1]|uniref:Ribokinase n=1 Tax=Aspergillus clavatus (strain ATCC 1007 / CBS 513.65 / DSM 816 / NCTC 3887 / NRRL 1 / QM 1276 / 107) TaxID=344612 RepID=A1C584_ASPCL|nr:ribokinase [Aspergillus clavatus NRRL 1]EAW14852.1 ribokinase [Aspergillus clavatus NRRL 1]
MAPLIRVIGSLNADMVSVTPRFPDPGETITASSYFISAGGKGANQAVACGRLSRRKPSTAAGATRTSSEDAADVKVEMVGAVGALDGHFGALLKPTLEKSGVATARVREVEGAYTGVAVIIVDSSAGGENRILFSPGANYQGMRATAEVVGMGLAAPVPDVIVMQGEIPVETVIGILRDIAAWKARNRAAGKRGVEAGPDVMFNPAPAPPGGLPEDVYAAVDHLIMNETEAELMSPPVEQLLKVVPGAEGADGNEKVARYFHQLGVTYVLITLGSKGVWYSATDAGTSGPVDGVRRFAKLIPAAKVSKVLDTTAAGDTFGGAYAVEVARWRESRRAEGKAGLDVAAEEKVSRYQDFMDHALGLATRASARCVERQGAMDSIPWEDEI